ncbi:hypothetical protein [Streptomyces sp. NPDC093097]|uniref:hypothetical protein n=1 Tax=Streptomyces sp. NPDC093097 TaxID=3366027 RepID=UPI00380524A6
MRQIPTSPRNEAGTGPRRRSPAQRGGRATGRPPFAALARAAALTLAAASTLTAALALATSPPAAARTGPLQRPSGDNCAYAGTAPPVHLPTEFPVPPGWHIPCTRPTHRPAPTPAPPQPTRTATPRPPSRPTPTHPPAPRPTPPAPPPVRHTLRAPAPPPAPSAAPRPAVPHPAATRPARPHGYAPPAPHRPHHGRSVVTRTLLITTPAVLAGVALRPRSRPSSRSTGRGSS